MGGRRLYWCVRRLGFKPASRPPTRLREGTMPASSLGAFASIFFPRKIALTPARAPSLRRPSTDGLVREIHVEDRELLGDIQARASVERFRGRRVQVVRSRVTTVARKSKPSPCRALARKRSAPTAVNRILSALVRKRAVLTRIFPPSSSPHDRYILVYQQGCDVHNHLSLFLCVADYDKLLPGARPSRSHNTLATNPPARHSYTPEIVSLFSHPSLPPRPLSPPSRRDATRTLTRSFPPIPATQAGATSRSSRSRS